MDILNGCRVTPARLVIEKEEILGVQAFRVTLPDSRKLGEDEAAKISVRVPDTDFLAYRNGSFWCMPIFGNKLSEIPDPTSALLLKTDSGYLYVMCAVGQYFKTMIRGAAHGFDIYLYSGTMHGDLLREPSFLVAEGEDPISVMDAAARAMCKFLDNGLSLRASRGYPDVLRKIGWCSWDAFQIRVNHKGLLDKAREFREKKVPIGFAIIDDMWADVPGLNDVPESTSFGEMVEIMHRSKLKNFEGDPHRFPEGMKKAVSDLKAAGIPDVGLWFPTTGYWSGVVPGEGADKLQNGNLVTLPNGKRLVRPESGVAERYFNIYCEKALDFGCSFVKIDNQGFYPNYKGVAPIGQAARAIQRAIDRVATERFGGRIINCMGMPTECMYNRPKTAVARCSDDFMPENREWFAKNILECAYSGLTQGRFYVNDWDMWWTDDAQAKKNSLCRATSGGPIYVSDKLGRTRPEILLPLILSDGTILRCDESATPTADCVISDPTKTDRIFKIRNRIGKTGVVAVFNISEKNAPVTGTVSALDARLPDGEYYYYEHFTGACGKLGRGESLPVSLSSCDEFRHFTLVPARRGAPTVFGRIDKFNARAAVLSEEKDAVTLAEGGRFAFASAKPFRVYAGEQELTVERRGALSVVETGNDVKLRFVAV